MGDWPTCSLCTTRAVFKDAQHCQYHLRKAAGEYADFLEESEVPRPILNLPRPLSDLSLDERFGVVEWLTR